MDKLLHATLPYGLMPPVVMEFPGITVGGGFSGSAGESNSFRHGPFSQTVKSIEMILASGDIVTASHAENTELFKGSAGALGTLGIVTKLELGLIPAKSFVKLNYTPFPTVHDTVSAIQHAVKVQDNDYVDGLLFSGSHGLVMTGQLTDHVPLSHKPQTFSGAWDPWFYLHAKNNPRHEPSTDYIPLPEYLFRYDRGGFWMGQEAFRYFGTLPFNQHTCWFLNDFMHTRMLYRALHATDSSSRLVIQDLALPYHTVEEFINYTTSSLGIWPLWLCPLPPIDTPTFHPYASDAHGTPIPTLNLGVWGPPPHNTARSFFEVNRDLETKFAELGGRKVLYSHAYYKEKEFWALYDREWYTDLRRKFGAETLPTVYDKVKVNERRKEASWAGRLASSWPVAGILGIRSAIQSGDYLLHRQPCWTRWDNEEAK